jgi:hypothetical protein
VNEVIAIVHALPLAIKAGWVIWMAWVAAQVVWYRRARVAAAATPAVQPATAPPVARRRPEPRPEPRPDPRPEPRSVRQEAVPATASLPALDLSMIFDQASASDESTPQPAGSILGLDPRPSSN